MIMMCSTPSACSDKIMELLQNRSFDQTYKLEFLPFGPYVPNIQTLGVFWKNYCSGRESLFMAAQQEANPQMAPYLEERLYNRSDNGASPQKKYSKASPRWRGDKYWYAAPDRGGWRVRGGS